MPTAAAASMTGGESTTRPTSRAGRSSKTPRIFRAYKESMEEEYSSTERPSRRGVTFRDTVETFPVSGRMDRLRRLLYEEAEEQRKRHTKDMRKTYRDQLREIQQEQEKERAAQQKRKMPVSRTFLPVICSMGPLHDLVTWCKIHYAGWQVVHWGILKQQN